MLKGLLECRLGACSGLSSAGNLFLSLFGDRTQGDRGGLFHLPQALVQGLIGSRAGFHGARNFILRLFADGARRRLAVLVDAHQNKTKRFFREHGSIRHTRGFRAGMRGQVLPCGLLGFGKSAHAGIARFFDVAQCDAQGFRGLRGAGLGIFSRLAGSGSFNGALRRGEQLRVERGQELFGLRRDRLRGRSARRLGDLLLGVID